MRHARPRDRRAGRGAAQGRGARRRGPALGSLGVPVRAQLEILCETLRRAWRVPPLPSLPSGADKAAWLAGFIAATWEELGRPCRRPVVAHARALAQARAEAFDADAAVLVHGDAHAFNALRATDGEFRLIDPDGLFAEPAYDLAIPMREYTRELLAAPDTRHAAEELCAELSRLSGVDARPIWEWGFVERVSSGLLLLQVGHRRLGEEMLAVADALAPTP